MKSFHGSLEWKPVVFRKKRGARWEKLACAALENGTKFSVEFGRRFLSVHRRPLKLDEHHNTHPVEIYYIISRQNQINTTGRESISASSTCVLFCVRDKTFCGDGKNEIKYFVHQMNILLRLFNNLKPVFFFFLSYTLQLKTLVVKEYMHVSTHFWQQIRAGSRYLHNRKGQRQIPHTLGRRGLNNFLVDNIYMDKPCVHNTLRSVCFILWSTRGRSRSRLTEPTHGYLQNRKLSDLKINITHSRF
jgi:hypothetical protein